MINLDNSDEIKKLDSQNMIGSIQALGEQLRVAWGESRAIQIPPTYKNVQNIVVAGMGGSALGAHFVRSVFDLPLPFQIVNDYKLPSFVNEKSLVIVCSYSGTTEETISALEDAVRKKAKVVGISTGHALIEKLKEKVLPYYQFDPKFNPTNQPRAGLGYLIGGILGFFANLEFIKLGDLEMGEVSAHLEKLQVNFAPTAKTERNEAKKTATALLGKIPIVIASAFLAGNAHVFANQVNESAKTFAAYFVISEMNHHLLEGIRFPRELGSILKFVFLETDLYSQKIKTRSGLTKQVLSKAGIESISYGVESNDKVQAAFEALVFSSWTSFYLAAANEIDPTPIPNVDFFKQELAKLA